MIQSNLRKTDWCTRLARDNDESIPTNEEVKLWVLPQGCRCRVELIDGVSTIRNGHHLAVNTELGNLLLAAGIVGDFILFSTKVVPQNTSRWLTYWLSQHEDVDGNMNSIHISTFGQRPTKALPFQVSTISPILTQAKDVIRTLTEKSSDASISLFLVKRNNGEQYELEPSRKTSVKIIAWSEYGYIVRSSRNEIFRVPRVSNRVMKLLMHHRVQPIDLVGQDVVVEYTMYTEGKRLCPYKCPVIYRVQSLEDMGGVEEALSATYEKQFPFNSVQTLRRGSLTPTRCKRSTIVYQENVIIGVEEDTDTELFRFIRGGCPGRYGAALTVGDGTELWTFSSDFSVDSLSPKAFINCTNDLIFEKTGYTIEDISIHYLKDNVPYLGERLVYSLKESA